MKTIMAFITILALSCPTGSLADEPRLFDSYFGLANALARDDSDEASRQAGLLATQLSGNNPALDNASRQLLLKNAKQIAGTRKLDLQRARFSNISAALTPLAKLMKPAGQVVCVVFCPMAKRNWLSSEKTARNPYYGSAMLSCGTVTETIN